MHYEKYGGFQELLNGVWEVLPEGTPLIGGTVAGFMSMDGVFSRGVSSVAISGKLDAVPALSRGTRKNPQKVALEVARQLIGKHLILTFMPGPSMPITGKGERIIVSRSKYSSRLAPQLLKISTTKFNKGVGREMEVLDKLAEAVKSDIIGGSTIDDNRYHENYQFFQNSIFTDALVSIGLRGINYKLATVETMPMPEKWYKVTKKGAFGHVVQKIENIDAIDIYIRELGYDRDIIFEEPNLVHRRFVFVPAVTKDQYGNYHPRCPGAFHGGSLGFGHPVFDLIGFSTTNGRYILNSFINFFKSFQKETKFLLSFCCAVLFEALGKSTYILWDKIREVYDKDYMMLFSGGEFFSPKENYKGARILEMSLTGVSLW
ncbi:MAG: hypothetical protein DRO01_07775 [Thermoproteota archaeon]|nr:MAG: hypothetical protein DRO01_07775 [Candidatus Korarchaeota archaeon]